MSHSLTYRICRACVWMPPRGEESAGGSSQFRRSHHDHLEKEKKEEEIIGDSNEMKMIKDSDI